MSNRLPDGWEMSTLGEVCEINPSRKEIAALPDDLDVSFVPMAAVSEDGRLIDAKTRKVSEVKKTFPHFKDRDVLIAKITPCFENGKRWLANSLTNGVGFGSTEFHVLRAKGRVVPEWVYYFVSLPELRKEGQRRMTGTAGQKRVPASFLEEHSIPVPLPAVQEKIVLALRRAERLKETRERANQLTNKIIQSVFLKTFGDPLTNPRDWPIRTIGEVTVYHQQGFYTNQEYTSTGTPILRISDITESGEILYENAPLLDIPQRDVDKFQPKVGDLLVARSGVSLGRCAIFRREDFPCVYGAYLIRFRFNSHLVLPEYVQAFLMSGGILSGVRRDISHKSAQPNINAQEIKQITIPIPPLPLQVRFSECLISVQKVTKTQTQSTQAIKVLFETVMHKAFSGGLAA